MSPFLIVSDSCPYSLINDFTNTDDASAYYPAGTTTSLIWTVIDSNGNMATCDMDVTIDFSTSNSYLNNEIPHLILYPNPNNGIFILEETSENNINDILVSIFDPLGRKVYEQSKIFKGTMSIDLTEQATGIYFLHWSTKESSGFFKLIIE